MVRHLAKQGADFTLHYCTRQSEPPILTEMKALCGERLMLYASLGVAPRRLDAQVLFA
jgi:hypothetical protein